MLSCLCHSPLERTTFFTRAGPSFCPRSSYSIMVSSAFEPATEMLSVESVLRRIARAAMPASANGAIKRIRRRVNSALNVSSWGISISNSIVPPACFLKLRCFRFAEYPPHFFEQLIAGKRLGENLHSFQSRPVLQPVVVQEPRDHQNSHAEAACL